MVEVYAGEALTALTPHAPAVDPQHFQLPDDVYYRSRVFSSQAGINPLINAAQPLIALLHRMANSARPPQSSDPSKNLHHEIHAFETRARACEYPAETILIGRYLLTVTLYHRVLQTPWGVGDERMQITLQRLIPTQNRSEQHVMSLLNKLMQSPTDNIDCLELAYCCLSLGFADIERSAQAQQQFDQQLHELYAMIRQQKPSFSKTLLLSAVDISADQTPRQTLSMAWVLSLAAVIMLSLSMGFDYMLNQTAKPIQHQIAAVAKTLNSHVA